MTFSLEYVEHSLLRECAALINDRCAKKDGNFTISAAQVAQIEEQIGPRACRIALRGARFKPATDDSGDWHRGKFPGSAKECLPLDPEDFGLALDDLDPSNALGLREVA